MRKMLTSCRRCNAKRSIDHHPNRDDQFCSGSVSAGRVSGDTYNLRIVRWVLSPQHEIICVGPNLDDVVMDVTTCVRYE